MPTLYINSGVPKLCRGHAVFFLNLNFNSYSLLDILTKYDFERKITDQFSKQSLKHCHIKAEDYS